MVTSGTTYNGRELYEMGIVHHLAEIGKSQESVRKFIRQHRRLPPDAGEVVQRHGEAPFHLLGEV